MTPRFVSVFARPELSALARDELALLGVYAAAALTWGWAHSDTLRLTLLAVLLLKWAESKSASEDALVVAATLVAVAIGSLNWNEAGALAWIALALPCALLALRTPDGLPDGLANIGRKANFKAALRALLPPLRHLAAALPLAGVLFVFFPRIPGPLWDIGLSFGLPLAIGIDQSPTGLGVSASLKPGETQTGAQMAAATPVLVAEFENWVPPTSTLYWRGPTLFGLLPRVIDGHPQQTTGGAFELHQIQSQSGDGLLYGFLPGHLAVAVPNTFVKSVRPKKMGR